MLVDWRNPETLHGAWWVAGQSLDSQLFDSLELF